MTNHFSYFEEILHPPSGAKLKRVLQIYSSEPIERIYETPEATVDVARWVPGIDFADVEQLVEDECGAWECYGDAKKNHNGINEAQFLFHWNGISLSHASRYFPFSPVPNCPGEFRAISRILSNPRLDRLLFSQAGDEATLYRLHAYHPPVPEVIPFRRVPTEQIPWLAAAEDEAYKAAGELGKKAEETLRRLNL